MTGIPAYGHISCLSHKNDIINVHGNRTIIRNTLSTIVMCENVLATINGPFTNRSLKVTNCS